MLVFLTPPGPPARGGELFDPSRRYQPYSSQHAPACWNAPACWISRMHHAGAWCIVLVLILCSVSFAAEFRGTIKDYSNGRPVQGAVVKFPTFDVQTATDSEGRFRFTDLSAGTYGVMITATGFHTYNYEQTFDDSASIVNVSIELKPSVAGETTAEYQQTEPRYNMPEVTVMTTRASHNDPVTYTNLNQKEVQQRTYGQDLPLLFTEMPNVVAYSDGANGVGYSYLRMRGFGQNRVAVQVNGTPLNDAGDGEVYWIDLPDFAEDLQDVQVQRGVGSSLYGPAAFGGTINVVTRTPGLLDRPMLRAEGTYGAFNTRRAMVMFESNRINNSWGVAGRLTRMSTDGYKDNSWAKLWSYYLSAAHFTTAHTTRVIFYGGPEQTHLAYDGVSKDYLDGLITGDKSRDRKYNPLTYPGEIDNFFQPHYEIHDEWKISNKLNADNSLYLLRGDGYYDQYREQQDPAQYFYGAAVADSQINVLRRRNIGETDWGWIPRLTYDHRYGETTLGGEVRLHDAHHDGQVLWANDWPSSVPVNFNYYDYRIRKQSYSAYIHNLLNVTKNLKALVDVQFQSNRYQMDRDRLWGVTWSKSWQVATPRIGLNYQFLTPDGKSATPAAGVYVNFSEAEHEPASSDIYDPQDYAKLPINDGVEFRPVASGYDYIGHSLVPERMQNIEFGTNWQWVRGRIGVNYYWMSIHNEIVPYGPLDSLGVPLVVNADRTLHQGVEFIGAYEPFLWLNLSGNLALTDHHFVHYQELDWNSGLPVSRDGNRLAYDPPYIANLRAEFTYLGFFSALSLQATGKQFIDNTETDSSAVPAYALLNLDLGYRFTHLGNTAKAVELRVRVNNLLNREFVTFGYPDDNGTPVYMVGAPRALYTTMAVDF